MIDVYKCSQNKKNLCLQIWSKKAERKGLIDRRGTMQNHDDNTGIKSSLYPLLVQGQIFYNFHTKLRISISFFCSND